MALSLLQKRPDASSASNPSPTASQQSPTTSQADSSLQRLSDASSSIQDSDSETLDSSEVSTLMDSLLQSMSTQSGTALASHANQMPGNVLSLLQTAD